MCKKLIYLLSLVVVLGLSGLVQADTEFLGGVLEDAANWSNGFPSESNPGTVAVDGTTNNPNLKDWVVTQTAGTISGTALRVHNGEWTMTGGSFDLTGGLTARGGQIFTVDGDITINVAKYNHQHGETHFINATIICDILEFRNLDSFVDIYNAGVFVAKNFQFFYRYGTNANLKSQTSAVNFHSEGTGYLAFGGDRLSYVEDLINGTGPRLDNNGMVIDWYPGDGPAPNIMLDGAPASMSDFLVYYDSGSDMTVITLAPPEQAFAPSPADMATDVPRDNIVLSWAPGNLVVEHDVYFGTSFADVNEATTASEVYLGRQSETTYALDRLELGQTYYWRIDEVNDAHPNSPWIGDVWSFEVEPVGYPIAAGLITATASSQNSADEGPEKTIDGSGLEPDGTHSQDTGTMWLSAESEPGQSWIKYEFDQLYSLGELVIWNHNTEFEALSGFGIKEALIEVSPDGNDFTHLVTTELAQAAQSTVDMQGTVVKAVRITALSNRSGFFKQYGLSEIQFLAIPLAARELSPADGTVLTELTATLSWRAGRQAGFHNVYLSTDEQAVIDGNTPVVRVTTAQYTADLDLLGATYYWKVNEVNEAEVPAVWEGPVQSFTTPAFLVIDDFESYTDDDAAGEAIWQTWIDGYEVSDNGSQVGYLMPPYAEHTIVHDGGKSMPFFYNNSAGVTRSEVTRTFDEPQDWTLHGIKTLSLYFIGDPLNGPGQLYVKINETKVLYPGDPTDLQTQEWLEFSVDLSALSVTEVTQLTIGIEGTDTGKILIDDIRLYH